MKLLCKHSALNMTTHLQCVVQSNLKIPSRKRGHTDQKDTDEVPCIYKDITNKLPVLSLL